MVNPMYFKRFQYNAAACLASISASIVFLGKTGFTLIFDWLDTQI